MHHYNDDEDDYDENYKDDHDDYAQVAATMCIGPEGELHALS